MSLLTILLQAAGGSQQWSGILMMVVIVAIFYFFMIRPQSKKQKEIKKAREALNKGDKVVASGGIFGKIKSINKEEGTVSVEIAPEVNIKVSLDSIYPAGPEKKAEKKAEK